MPTPSIEERRSAACPLEADRNPQLLEHFLWKLLLLSAMAYFVWSEKISIRIGPLSIQGTELEQRFFRNKAQMLQLLGFRPDISAVELPAETPLRHTNFAIDAGYASRCGISEAVEQEGIRQCKIFTRKFAPVAIAEMRRSGVPASILLAQALLASNAGDDSLVRATNNFFLRSCLSNTCAGPHYTVEDGDSLEAVHRFPRIWGSFREQSEYFRNNAPFSELVQEGRRDYIDWVAVLAVNAYSEDAFYAEKLVALIRNLQLDKLDQRT